MCSPARDFPLSRNYSPGAVSTETHSRSSSSNLPFQYEKEIVCLPGVEPCLEKYQHCRIGGPFILPCSEVVPLEEDLCIYDLISQNAPSKTPRSSLFPSRMEPPEILTFTFLEAHPGGFGGGVGLKGQRQFLTPQTLPGGELILVRAPGPGLTHPCTA